MNATAESTAVETDTSNANELILPHGIIGFPNHRRAELLYSAEQLPFVWMRLHGPDTLHFVVVEASVLLPEYQPEIFGEDAALLELRDAADALVLNVVTLRGSGALGSTVNLVGPIIVNRRTRIARQRVIANHTRYSAQHPLVMNPIANKSARSA